MCIHLRRRAFVCGGVILLTLFLLILLVNICYHVLLTRLLSSAAEFVSWLFSACAERWSGESNDAYYCHRVLSDGGCFYSGSRTDAGCQPVVNCE